MYGVYQQADTSIISYAKIACARLVGAILRLLMVQFILANNASLQFMCTFMWTITEFNIDLLLRRNGNCRRPRQRHVACHINLTMRHPSNYGKSDINANHSQQMTSFRIFQLYSFRILNKQLLFHIWLINVLIFIINYMVLLSQCTRAHANWKSESPSYWKYCSFVLECIVATNMTERFKTGSKDGITHFGR